MNPVETMIKHAVEAYRKDLNEYESFEICAYIFFFLFVRLSRKPGEGSLSMMLVLALAIWDYSGSKIFKDKKINGDELMKRKNLFMDSGFDNRVRVLQTNLVFAAKSRSLSDDFFSQEKRGAVSLAGQNRHLEENLNEWVCVLAPLLPYIDRLIERAYTTQEKNTSPTPALLGAVKKEQKRRATFGRIWLSLSMTLIVGGILFFCVLLFH